MIKHCLTIISLALCGIAQSQNPRDTVAPLYISPGKHHALGYNLGFTNGIGVSYRFKHNNLAFQGNLLPMGLKSNGVGALSLGLTTYAYLHQSQKLSVFLFAGVHNLYSKSEEEYIETTPYYSPNTDYPYNVYTTHYRFVTKNSINIGIGPGLEMPVYYDLNFYVMTGYAVYGINKDPWTFLTFNGGFCYYFK